MLLEKPIGSPILHLKKPEDAYSLYKGRVDIPEDLKLSLSTATYILENIRAQSGLITKKIKESNGKIKLIHLSAKHHMKPMTDVINSFALPNSNSIPLAHCILAAWMELGKGDCHVAIPLSNTFSQVLTISQAIGQKLDHSEYSRVFPKLVKALQKLGRITLSRDDRIMVNRNCVAYLDNDIPQTYLGKQMYDKELSVHAMPEFLQDCATKIEEEKRLVLDRLLPCVSMSTYQLRPTQHIKTGKHTDIGGLSPTNS